MIRRKGESNSATVDHYIPRSALPVDFDHWANKNVVLACIRCNQIKADAVPNEIVDESVRVGPWERVRFQGWMWVGE